MTAHNDDLDWVDDILLSPATNRGPNLKTKPLTMRSFPEAAAIIRQKLTEAERAARLQGQWTATKSFMHQAEGLGEKDTKTYRQIGVHLKSVEDRIAALKATHNTEQKGSL